MEASQPESVKRIAASRSREMMDLLGVCILVPSFRFFTTAAGQIALPGPGENKKAVQDISYTAKERNSHAKTTTKIS